MRRVRISRRTVISILGCCAKSFFNSYQDLDTNHSTNKQIEYAGITDNCG